VGAGKDLINVNWDLKMAAFSIVPHSATTNTDIEELHQMATAILTASYKPAGYTSILFIT
jgi:hypothetical protein